VRFDHVYHTIPTTLAEDYRGVDDPRPEKWKRLQDYDNLLNYTRDIYQTDSVAETVNMDHIVRHYASPGSPQLHTHDVDDVDLGLTEPHNRAELSGAATASDD
jgi:putative glutathione S-transferase